MAGPCEGIRVVEPAVWVAGPSAGGILADWGADVVKIEPREGDPFRGLFMVAAGLELPANPPFELDNRGKRSVALDLRTDAGRAIALWFRLLACRANGTGRISSAPWRGPTCSTTHASRPSAPAARTSSHWSRSSTRSSRPSRRARGARRSTRPACGGPPCRPPWRSSPIRRCAPPAPSSTCRRPTAARRPASPPRSTPECGQHTEEILLELGYEWDAIAGLKERGAIP